jgi:hypothetical protein
LISNEVKGVTEVKKEDGDKRLNEEDVKLKGFEEERS